jgi:hypothetical protein
MKRIAIAICCCLFLVGIAAADAPHFTALCADLNSANATLAVTFKVAGVGNEPVNVTLADDIDFTCTTKGSGQETSAHQTVSVIQSFTPRNGSFRGSLSFAPTCPGTQIESNATFSGVTITVSRGNTILLEEDVTNDQGVLLIDTCR